MFFEAISKNKRR